MLFNSREFLIFLPLVLIAFALVRGRHRWLVLLIASYYFYMSWEPWYITLIVGSTVVDFISGQKIFKSEGLEKKLWLAFSLVANLGVLLLFKYYNFFIDNINNSFGKEIPYLQFLLPVGISFYTFQTLSYSLDIYQGKLKPESSFFRFALFVSFFPQLVAGPIERAKNLLPQLRNLQLADNKGFEFGLKLILWGLFKKVVIADNLAPIVDGVYADSTFNSSAIYWLASYFFAIQIYCDFSGYSDIAIGVARFFGVDLMKNFNRPYIATSIQNFWSRWHISLSTWFRDYLYIPLGGNRTTFLRWLLNLLIVFLVSGLWHGANWTFVVWGGIHGALLIIGVFIAKSDFLSGSINKLPTWIKQLVLFQLVTLAWVFFRANNVGEAWHMVGAMTRFNLLVPELKDWMELIGYGRLAFVSLMFGLFLILDWFFEKSIFDKSALVPLKIRGLGKLAYSFVAAAIVLFGNWGEVSFIYFQF